MEMKRVNIKASISCSLVAVALVMVTGAWVDAAVPSGRYMTSSGIVYDTKTKLTWQQIAPLTTYTWMNANTYCAGLDTTLGGTGWRLPTMKELQSIVDDSRSNPSIDPAAFPSTLAAPFWSSSPLVGSGSSVAWFVTFTFGYADKFVATHEYSVRCVR